MTNTYANKSDLKELLDFCEEYMLQKQTALQIISEVLACSQRMAAFVCHTIGNC